MRRMLAWLVSAVLWCPLSVSAEGFKRDSGYQADRSEWVEESAAVSLKVDTNNVVLGADTAGGKLFIDGDTDEIQLQVQGFSTQTTLPLVVENSGGTDVLTVSNAGAVAAASTITSSATGTLGWSVVNAANQACNTTCTSACVVGIDTAVLGNFLACTDAAADSCLCAGSS